MKALIERWGVEGGEDPTRRYSVLHRKIGRVARGTRLDASQHLSATSGTCKG